MVQPPVSYCLAGQQFWLSAARCLFWEEQRTLVLSDLHFGKTGHFRKEGIAVPTEIYQEDLMRLMEQVQCFKPEKIIFVGDLFHSRINLEIDWFHTWRKELHHIPMHLVVGNHDILPSSIYADMGLILHKEALILNPFCFVHEAPEKYIDQHYVISGHVHPGIRLSGVGKQSLRFPCFYFNPHYAILPAFSAFTGLALIEPKKDENVFAIVENQVILVS